MITHIKSFFDSVCVLNSNSGSSSEQEVFVGAQELKEIRHSEMKFTCLRDDVIVMKQILC